MKLKKIMAILIAALLLVSFVKTPAADDSFTVTDMTGREITFEKPVEKAVALTASLEQVGTALQKAQSAYDDTYKRLHTGNNNVVRLGQQLKKTARLQSKKEFSTALTEAVEEPEEE